MDLRQFGAVGEWLAIAGKAGAVSIDHRRITEDHGNVVSVLTDGDNLPSFVSSKLREREPIRHLQSVLVLRRYGTAAQGNERYDSDYDPCRWHVLAKPH
jgi:hypothetical protein